MKIDYSIKSSNLKKRPKSSEVDNLKCDNKKLKKNTNWKPKVSLEQGLKKNYRVDQIQSNKI